MPQSIGNLLGAASGIVSQAQSQINQAQSQFQSLSQAVSNPAGAVSSLLGGLGGNLTGGLSGIPSLSSLGGFAGMLSQAGQQFGQFGSGGYTSILDFTSRYTGGAHSESLEDMLAREDPAWQFQWSVDSIVAPPGMSPLPVGCRRPNDFIEAVDVVFPGAQQETNIERGSNVYYTGYMDAPTFTLTMFEYHDWRVTRWLETWRKCIYNQETGFYGLKDEYAGACVISLLDLGRSTALVRAKVMGIWPTQTQPIQLAGMGERVVIQQEFSQDDIEVS